MVFGGPGWRPGEPEEPGEPEYPEYPEYPGYPEGPEGRIIPEGPGRDYYLKICIIFSMTGLGR